MFDSFNSSTSRACAINNLVHLSSATPFHSLDHKARDYVQFVTQQRVGPVHIDLEKKERDDLTVVDVPEDCVGFVMGKGGNTLRSMEEEWGSLMFFAQVKEPGQDEVEKLCIFGSIRCRRGAELKVRGPGPGPCVWVCAFLSSFISFFIPLRNTRLTAVAQVMSAVEHKHPGHFIKGETLLECRRIAGDNAGEDWGTDTMLLTDDNFSYAAGMQLSPPAPGSRVSSWR